MTKDGLVSKDKALKMRKEQDEQWEKIIKVGKEALKQPAKRNLYEEIKEGIEDLSKQKPAQEPVPLVRNKNGNYSPKHQWQGLSNDMVRAIGEKCEEKNRGILNWIDFYNGIENMLKDKNNA